MARRLIDGLERSAIAEALHYTSEPAFWDLDLGIATRRERRNSSAPEGLRVKLLDIAQQLGVTVVEGTPEALDLRFTYYLDDACKKWLAHTIVALE